MQLLTELPSGKILDLARFIALIPVENTPQKNYELILEGYSSAISLEQDDAEALKKLLQFDLKISTTKVSTWDREEQLRKNQLALELLRKRIERNKNISDEEAKQREEFLADFKQMIDEHRLPRTEIIFSTMIVFLDSGVLGLLSNPNKSGEAGDCEQWLYRLLSKGVYVLTSELCDYEVRRGLILGTRKNPDISGIENLNELQEIITFLPVNSVLLREAASLWAEARIQGISTADDKTLDIDILICTQWKLLTEEFPGRYIVIATTNVKHLSRFTLAQEWSQIKV